MPATFLQPITMRHLLDNTAGFDLRLRNLFVSRREELRSIRDYLVSEMPDRLFAPGSVLAYSDYGLALAGYIVERVSGIPFKEYVRYQIFRPLQMNHTTFDQPLPEDLLPDMSNGYKAASDPPGNFEYIQAVPAGALSTTGLDIGRFMAALLNQGMLENAQIISLASLRQMEDRVIAVDRLDRTWWRHSNNGCCYALLLDRELRNMVKPITHDGASRRHRSLILVWPDLSALR
jgi:CubicO group peptidase (beta-lactamase class C family)